MMLCQLVTSNFVHATANGQFPPTHKQRSSTTANELRNTQKSKRLPAVGGALVWGLFSCTPMHGLSLPCERGTQIKPSTIYHSTKPSREVYLSSTAPSFPSLKSNSDHCGLGKHPRIASCRSESLAIREFLQLS